MSDYILKIGDREYRAQVREITSDRATIVVDDTTYDVDLVEIGRRPASARRSATGDALGRGSSAENRRPAVR